MNGRALLVVALLGAVGVGAYVMLRKPSTGDVPPDDDDAGSLGAAGSGGSKRTRRDKALAGAGAAASAIGAFLSAWTTD